MFTKNSFDFVRQIENIRDGDHYVLGRCLVRVALPERFGLLLLGKYCFRERPFGVAAFGQGLLNVFFFLVFFHGVLYHGLCSMEKRSDH